MSVWKGDFYRWLKGHIIEIVSLLLLIFTAYEILKAKWPF